MVAHNLLEKIFSTHESFLFMQEYEKFTQEFNKKFEYENQHLNELTNKENLQTISMDYFAECAKIFIKNETISSNETGSSNEQNLDLLKKQDLWQPKNKSYDEWLKNLVINLLNAEFLQDNICGIARDIFKSNVRLQFFLNIF